MAAGAISPAMLRTRLLLFCPALLALAACGEEPTPVASISTRPAPRRAAALAPRPALRPAPHVQSAPGLEGVIGASATDLARLFGPPRLDVMEGDARKLQYVGVACVLDIYLYPPRQGGDPRATYVDARRATDARDVDRAACVAALRRK